MGQGAKSCRHDFAPKPPFCCTRWVSQGGTVPTEIRSRWLMLALVTLLSVSCKQKSKEEADPAVAPSASAAPAETAPPTPPPPETIAPPTQPPPAVVAAAPKAQSLKTCWAAPHKEEGSAAPWQKSVYHTTAATSVPTPQR